jgi:UDP-N-acetylmuramoylalanine--D-glutamate ligase
MTELSEEVDVDRKSVAGMNISVIGAARSGAAVAELLSAEGAAVFVSDSGPAEKLEPWLSALRSRGVACETGAHTDRVFAADALVLSPGVPSSSPVVREAKKRGMRILSELEVASWFCRAPMVAITGTNGKTTTTTLLGRLLHDARKPHAVAGNIGTAFSSVAAELTGEAVAVLEVSSFQLDDIEAFHPKISVILNITPDHLDRYDHSFERYAASKCRIFENQTMEDYLIYCRDDEAARGSVERLARGRVRTIPFSAREPVAEGACLEGGILVTLLQGKRTEIVPADEISIRGVHNLYNAMAAALAAQLMGVSPASIRATLKNFKGVEHRLEFVRELHGVRYINDSKATNVNSVWYALQAFSEPVILLLGGRDKGNDYRELDDLVRRHVKAIVAIGESAEKVRGAFAQMKPVVVAGSMLEAVQKAAALAASGDLVLLSPACASFDWFENYEHRGKVFKTLVNEL